MNKQTIVTIIIVIILCIIIGLFTITYFQQQENIKKLSIDGSIAMNHYVLAQQLKDSNQSVQQIQKLEEQFTQRYYNIISAYNNQTINNEIKNWKTIKNQIDTRWQDANFDERKKLYDTFQQQMTKIDDLVYQEMKSRYLIIETTS